MNSANALTHIHSLSRFPLPHHHRTQCVAPLSTSSSLRPRRRRTHRRKNTKLTSTTTTTTTPSPDGKLQTVIDLNDLSAQTSSLLHTLQYSSQSQIHKIVYSAKDAYEDLQTLITLDDDRRVIVSCRRSTVYFVGGLVVWSFVLVFVFRVLGRLGLAVRRGLSGSRNEPVVVRRDRSLGGREVVVGRSANVERNIRASSNPLSPASGTNAGVSGRIWKSRVRSHEKKLPKWWPVSVSQPGLVLNKEEYQREANRLIRVIMDNRTNGKDIMDDEIIQLRQLCRTSGVGVSIDTKNTRDYFYRASVDLVLNVCSWYVVRAPSHITSVEIDGEVAPQFVAGLAENIGLEKIHAARIVSAAVAARTRSCFLQALEMQGKHVEAKLELSKICLIHRTFPPEEFSPEMEMVARGLEKHLKVEQRELLLSMFAGVCSEESHRSATEALGLMPSPEGVGDLQ
ncbi:uncharacterized protein LOC132181239 isoform X2 [Corylus avellana]|uniref:uncharacterized protein LOC132181239 isoform X2 n=1 Tax=Corylus avellana TaxID=13451 RepID=UPI00286A141C|nr:uncharacterized protein LOC132181239 isoform X2 [Corylus avellana]